jgi:hypothetical protein
MQKNLLCLLLIIINVLDSIGQNNSVSNLEATGIWNGVYIKGKFTNKLGYYGEHHYRLGNSADNPKDFIGITRQVYNRAGLNIFVNPHFEIVVGPTLVFNFTPDPGNPSFEKVTLEPRIWHQWLFTGHELGNTKLYHQFRFEHRWKRSNEIDAPFNYTNRYRYKIFAYIPLNSKKIKEKTLYFSPSAEIFLQSGKSIVFNPFEDFRTYNGIGYVYKKNITFFAGHMWTLGQKQSGFEYRSSHILRFNVMVSFDARKIENKLPSINLGF